MVREAIAWMRVRALTTTDKLAPGALMPNGNRVAPKPKAEGGKVRIPKQTFRFLSGLWSGGDSIFVATESALAVRDGPQERRRFGGSED